ncbi:MAG: hypothetical protein M3Y87_11380, partial [Myxococcota bacterium]|nr:hypothetical protein [Myxococcota bacterium]
VRARVERDAGVLTIDERLWARVAAGDREVRLWVYADRLSVAPRVLGERTWRWLYPGDVDRGEVTIERVTIDGGDAIDVEIERAEGGARGRDVLGADVVVPIEPGEARTIELAISLRVRVPARFGRMGRDGSTLALAAPWYPLVVGADDAWRYVVPHRVAIDAGDGDVWLGGELREGRSEVSRETSYVPALLAPRVHVWRGTIAGVDVTWSSFEEIYVPPGREAEGEEGLDDLVHIDRVALLREAMGPVIETARWLGIAIPERLDLLMVPSRTELAATAPGVVLISDRFGQVFPADVVREFQIRALRRALFARLAQPIADRQDAPADRGWAEDLRSVVLLELDDVRRSSEAQTPQELLSAFAFHPAIDQLLYAPQIAFEDVYFSAIDEPDPYRDDPARARVPFARGRRVLESARDVLSEEAFQRFVAMIANGRRSVRSALERVDPSALLRLPIWLEYPQLPVNYRLGEIVSERTEDGRWRHRVEVIREGAHRVEPVEVEVEDASGARATGVWDGPGARGEVVIETDAERRGVTVDPRHRLPQSASIAEGHPRADDATEQPWRPPIFTGFAFDVLASEANVTGVIDVVLRRRYDLEHTVSLRLLRTAARTGGRLRYLQSVGPKVHENRRSMTLGAGLGFYYVHPGFGGRSQIGGYATEIDLLLAIDTRSYVYDWREGFSVVWQVQATTTVLEDGTVGASARATARASNTWAIGNLHAIVLVGHAGLTINPVLDADLQSMGGRYGLRGFANDELLGTSALYAVAEHRFTVVTDVAWNVFHALWARELQLAWWLGGGVLLGAADGRDAVGAGEAGLGLRVHYEYAGIQPGVLAIDVGVPISRWAQSPPCFLGTGGACDARSVPVGFYVSVDQYY